MRFGSRRILIGDFNSAVAPVVEYLPLAGPFSNLTPVDISTLLDLTISSNTTAPAMSRANPLKVKTLTISAATIYDSPVGSGFWIWADEVVFTSASAQIRSNPVAKDLTADGGDAGSGGGAGGTVSGTGASGGAAGNNGGTTPAGTGGTGFGSYGSSPFTLPTGGTGGPGPSSGPNLGGAGGIPGPNDGIGGGGGGAAGSVSSVGGGGGGSGKIVCIVANRITGASGIIKSQGANGARPPAATAALRGGRGGGGTGLVLARLYSNVITSQLFQGFSTSTSGEAKIYSIRADLSTVEETFGDTWDYT